MKKPRVLYLSTSLNIGGTERFLVQLATHFKDAYDIEIGFLKEKGQLGVALEGYGFKVLCFDNPFSLWRYLRSRRVDILQTFLYRAHVIGRIVGKLAGVRNIITTQQAVDIWKSVPLSIIDRLTAPLSGLVITNSRAAMERLHKSEKIPFKKMRVIYNGIDPEGSRVKESREDIRKELQIAPDAVVAVCVTRLHHDKGSDLLPPVMSAVEDMTFLVVGDGPLKEEIENQVASRGISKRIKMLGWRRDVSRLLKASDIFVLPSREESFPQAVLEAMALELPVVASDVGGVRELVEHNRTGFLSRPGAINEFIASIRLLKDAPSLRAEMGKAGYAKSQEFSEVRLFSEMNEVYHGMIEKSQ